MKSSSITKVSLFIALLAISAQFKIPLGIISITLQTLVVYLCGLLLTRKEAAICLSVYILMGLIGLPVFASGGGLSYIFVPSFGYLIGFLCAAIFIASVKNKMNPLLACVIATLIIYAIGISYFLVLQYFMYQQTYTISWIFYSLFLVFIPGDMICAYIATLISKRLKKSKV